MFDSMFAGPFVQPWRSRKLPVLVGGHEFLRSTRSRAAGEAHADSRRQGPAPACDCGDGGSPTGQDASLEAVARAAPCAMQIPRLSRARRTITAAAAWIYECRSAAFMPFDSSGPGHCSEMFSTVSPVASFGSWVAMSAWLIMPARRCPSITGRRRTWCSCIMRSAS